MTVTDWTQCVRRLSDKIIFFFISLNQRAKALYRKIISLSYPHPSGQKYSLNMYVLCLFVICFKTIYFQDPFFNLFNIERITQAQNQLILHLLYQWRYHAMLYWSLSCNHLHCTRCSLQFLSPSLSISLNLFVFRHFRVHVRLTLLMPYKVHFTVKSNGRFVDLLIVSNLVLWKHSLSKPEYFFFWLKLAIVWTNWFWVEITWLQKKIDNHCSIENRS